MCLVDIIKHLPRSLWSESQLEIYLWSLRMFGVNKVPSIQMVKDFEDDLQARCGIKTLRREGKLGNLFYLNDLAGIVSQVKATPLPYIWTIQIPLGNGQSSGPSSTPLLS